MKTIVVTIERTSRIQQTLHVTDEEYDALISDATLPAACDELDCQLMPANTSENIDSERDYYVEAEDGTVLIDWD